MDFHRLPEEQFTQLKTLSIMSVGIVSFYEELPNYLVAFCGCFELPEIPNGGLSHKKTETDIGQLSWYKGEEYLFVAELTRDSNEYPFLDVRIISDDPSRHFYLRLHSNRSMYPHTTLMANQISLYVSDVTFGDSLLKSLECWIEKMGV